MSGSSPARSVDLVDSLLHPQADRIRQLLTRSGRQELDCILIDDEENIRQALRAGVKLEALYYSGDESILKQGSGDFPRDIRIYEIARRTCKKLFEAEKSSRLFAVAKTPVPISSADLLKRSGDILAIEDVSISGNAGAIIRTSLALGAAGVIFLNKETVDLYDRRLIRASRGYIFSLPITAMPVENLLGFCEQHGLTILAMDSKAGGTVDEISFLFQRLVIVLGGEKKGISSRLSSASISQVRIPISPEVESLNVSVAASIALFNRLPVWQSPSAGNSPPLTLT